MNEAQPPLAQGHTTDSNTAETTQNITESGVCGKRKNGDNDRSATPSEQVPGASLRRECATGVLTPALPPDVAGVVKAWPELQEPIRAAILAMIQSATATRR